MIWDILELGKLTWKAMISSIKLKIKINIENYY